MKIAFTPTESPAKNSTDAQPLQQRLAWEKEWLEQNRSAFKVIKNDEEKNSNQSAERSNRQAIFFGRSAPFVTEQTVNSKPGNFDYKSSAVDFVAGSQSMSSADKTVKIFYGDIFENGNWTPLSNPQLSPALPSVTSAEVEEIYRRHEFRQFAVWREGKNIAVSMRLPKELQNDRSIFLAMRQWLADSGYALRQIIVNGLSRWKV